MRCWAQRDDRGLSELESELARLGVSLHGYADVRGLFSGEWGEWPRAISLALALPVDELRDVRSGGPTPAYYDAYLAANAILNAASREVASLLQHLGYRATPYPATVSAGDLQADLGAALTAPVHHKAVATRTDELHPAQTHLEVECLSFQCAGVEGQPHVSVAEGMH